VVPVRRYRDVADMAAPVRARSAIEGLTHACDLSELTTKLGRGAVAPRGVRRFRSVEEADTDRREREILAIRQRALRSPPKQRPSA